jgi:hypothetical protein
MPHASRVCVQHRAARARVFQTRCVLRANVWPVGVGRSMGFDLRPLTINVVFCRGGAPVYTCTTCASPPPPLYPPLPALF